MKTILLLFHSKKNRINHQKLFCVSLAVFLVISFLSSFYTGVYAESSIDSLVEEVQAADAQLLEISKERFEIDQMITAINAEIPGIKAKNQELTKKLEDGKKDMEARLRVMYMYNTSDIFQLLFSSTSFSSFISRVDRIVSVYSSDRDQLNELKSIQEEIENNELQLANDLNLLNESKSVIVEKEIEIGKICAERQAKLNDARVAATYEEASRVAARKEKEAIIAAESQSQQSSNVSESAQSSELTKPAESSQSETTSNSDTTIGNATQSSINSDFNTICAIVRHEGGPTYEGSLAVISCVMNRVDVGWGGNDALSVLTAPYQFESYTAGYYKQYLGADIPETRRAVSDCMYGGIRSHNYLSFRGYETEGSVNIAGNWYFNPMN